MSAPEDVPGTPPGHVPAAVRKALERRRVRARRAARRQDGEAVGFVAEGLRRAGTDAPALVAAARAGRTVTAYAALPGEPDPGPLRAALGALGARVLLPVVAGPGELRWGADGPTRPGHRLPGGHRLDEPRGDPAGLPTTTDLALGRDDVLLVPALAVSADGARLGQGGGYYDRALALLAAHPVGPLVVAVLHDDELLPAGRVPLEPHERPVDAALTPSGWIALPLIPRQPLVAG